MNSKTYHTKALGTACNVSRSSILVERAICENGSASARTWLSRIWWQPTSLSVLLLNKYGSTTLLPAQHHTVTFRAVIDVIKSLLRFLCPKCEVFENWRIRRCERYVHYKNWSDVETGIERPFGHTRLTNGNSLTIIWRLHLMSTFYLVRKHMN